jgi:hypothetical protein
MNSQERRYNREMPDALPRPEPTSPGGKTVPDRDVTPYVVCGHSMDSRPCTSIYRSCEKIVDCSNAY